MLDKKIHLLVVDDDDINIFIIRKIVEKSGYNIALVAKSNGKQAIDYLINIQETNNPLPDLILTDINMPVMNGWDFLEAYQKLGIPTDIDLHILSSSVYDNDFERAKNYPNVKGFISKPFSNEILVNVIKNLQIKL